MQVSHSRVETFLNCPFKYKLRYVDQLETYDNLDDPSNALIIGSALHKGIEEGVQAGIDLYTSSFPILTDVHIHEIMKLENLIPKAQKTVPDGAVFEKLISDFNKKLKSGEAAIEMPTIQFDEGGNILNYDELQDAMYQIYNKAADTYSSDSEEW